MPNEIFCEGCRRPVSIDDIKYLPKGEAGRIALCPACRTKRTAEAKKQPAKPELIKILYMCAHCNFKFKFEPSGNSKLRCPYCGKADKLVEESKLTVDNLLKTAYEDF